MVIIITAVKIGRTPDLTFDDHGETFNNNIDKMYSDCQEVQIERN